MPPRQPESFGLRSEGEITKLAAGDEIWFDPTNGRLTLARQGHPLMTGANRECDKSNLDFCEALLSPDPRPYVPFAKSVAELIAASHGLKVSRTEETLQKNRIIFRLGT